MEQDFSLDNENVKKYFSGESEDPPVSEMMYLHERPLLRPNFLTQIEKYLSENAEIMSKRGITNDKRLARLSEIAIEMGQILSHLTHSNAGKFLEASREACSLCAKITGKRLM